MRRYIATFAVIIVLMRCARKTLVEQPTPATICHITQRAREFDNRLVRVSAEVHYGVEYTALHDPMCPEARLMVVVGDPNRKTALRALNDVIYRHGTLAARVTGTFIGRFRWHPHDRPAMAIELTQASNVVAQ
jgi:hypothetical protein